MITRSTRPLLALLASLWPITLLAADPVPPGWQPYDATAERTTAPVGVPDSGLSQTIPALSPEEAQSAEQLVQEVTQRGQQEQTAAMPTPQIPADAIRINYIPEAIKQEIREQIRSELRSDVVQDVLAQAKNERWGIPQALPEWTNRISWKGDLRLRLQSDLFADGNAAYLDYPNINDNGGYGYTDIEDLYLNTTEDRDRLRLRARLGADVKVNTEVSAALRVSTGHLQDPVSTNQTLGQSGKPYQVVWDRAYLKYDPLNADDYPWLSLRGGRMENPWFSTDLVWDNDLAFEGIAATFRYNLAGSDSLLELTDRSGTLYATVGAFPLQEIELSSKDKWLYGVQVGSEHVLLDQSVFKIGVAYYLFKNITGIRNELNSVEYDYTAPISMQKGNTLFDIRNDLDVNSDLSALASEYEEMNLTATYDYAGYAPYHVYLTADVVINLGYDRDEIAARTGGVVDRAGGSSGTADPLEAKTLGYQLIAGMGWPAVSERDTWRIYAGYKYLERDAVVDAYTDSDFHLGGTDAKGWFVGGDYALIDDVVLSGRWISSDAIDAAPLGVDTLQLDINARF